MSEVKINSRIDGKNGSRSEMFAVLETDDGRKFEFHLKKHRINVEPERVRLEGGKKGDSLDWFDERVISEEDRVKVFAAIMGEYRKRSLGDGEWRGAAIGMTEDNKLFIGLNTKRQTDYFKDCAEQNMLNAATDAVVFERAVKSKDYTPKPPRLKAIYVMGGREPDPANPEDKGTPISCVCGKCTDMLANAMDADADVYTIPIKYGTPNGAPIINKSAHSMNQVLPGEVWKCPIGHLNRLSALTLDQAVADVQRTGLGEAMKYATSRVGLAGWELPAELKPHSKVHTSGLVMEVLSAAGKAGNDLRKFGDVAFKAAENALFGRKSVAELDVAVRGGGVDLSQVNAFMVQKIDDAVASRLRAMVAHHPEKQALIPHGDNASKFLDKLEAVRCCVIQLEDGTFHYALDARSVDDYAMPNAEVNAMTAALERLTVARVKNVWVMEMRPKDIEQGVMHLSPKEGVERLVKRGTRSGDMRFTHIPFNDGKLNEGDVHQISEPHSMTEIFPAAFKGSKFMHSNGDGGQTTAGR